MTVTVNSERYVAVLQSFFILYLEENEWDIPHAWFQKDGAMAHTTIVSKKIIGEAFAECVISMNGDIPWPPRLSDLSPCDLSRQTTHHLIVERGY